MLMLCRPYGDARARQEHALTFPLVVDRKLDQIRQLMGVGEGAGAAAGAIDRDLHAAFAGLREDGPKARAIFPGALAKSPATTARPRPPPHLAPPSPPP